MTETRSYTFFFSHDPAKYPIENQDHAKFSQWWVGKPFISQSGTLIHDLSSHFTMPSGESYTSTEKWMMLGKARMFKDKEAEEAILATDDPRKIKAIGRGVKNFDAKTWNSVCWKHVTNGNYLKFGQDLELRKLLLSTKGSHLVEATNGDDKIWGIGYPAGTLEQREVALANIENWGLNLLGQALMDTRTQLIIDDAHQVAEGKNIHLRH